MPKGGITPFAAFAFAPILGYFGDKVVIVDIITLIATVISGTQSPSGFPCL